MKETSSSQPPPTVDLILTVALAGAINQRYTEVMDFLNEEIRVLRELIDSRQLPLTDDQRRRLAARFVKLDRALAAKQELIVTPETIMRWYRSLIRQKWDYCDRSGKRGRPPLDEATVKQVLSLLEENPTWGDDTISNRCENIGIKVSAPSVRAIRKRHGIPPAPERQKTGSWSRFLTATWPTLVAMDFTTVEVLDPATNTLETYYVLFAMRLATREVNLVGITQHPGGEWLLQQARNLTDDFDGFFREATHCIIDNDSIFSTAFVAGLRASGVKCVKTSIHAPNMNAFIERFMLTFKIESLHWTIPLSEWHLREISKEFLAYYNTERNHQGLDEKVISPGPEVGQSKGPIACRERLGGTLRYYYREAA